MYRSCVEIGCFVVAAPIGFGSLLQNTVSNKSLVEMARDLVKDAVTVRKSLLGYMGDKQMSFPETLAQNILMKGLDKPKIRDEVYLQVGSFFHPLFSEQFLVSVGSLRKAESVG